MRYMSQHGADWKNMACYPKVLAGIKMSISEDIDFIVLGNACEARQS
jgi:hypothetical protein